MSSPASTGIRTPWRAVAGLFIVSGALFGVWAARIPTVAAEHGLSKSALGLLLLIMGCGALVSFALSGRAADRLGPAPVARAMAVFLGAMLILVSLAPNVPVLAVVVFGLGAAHGALDVAMNVWAAEVERAAGRPAMSSFHAMFSLGAGAGAGTGFLAGAIGLGFAPHAALVAAILVGAALWFAAFPWDSPRRQAERGPLLAIPRGALLGVAGFAFCASVGEGGMADWSALFLIEVTGADEGRAALGFAVFSAAMVAARLAGDGIVERLGAVAVGRASGALAVMGSLVALTGGTYGIILAGFALLGFGYALVVPLAFSRAANDPHVPQGEALASVATLGYGGFLVAPPAIGFLADATSIYAVFVVFAVLSAGMIGLAGRLGR